MTDKRQIHIRASAETDRKLRELAMAYGTMTTAVAVAVNRLYSAYMAGDVDFPGRKGE